MPTMDLSKVQIAFPPSPGSKVSLVVSANGSVLSEHDMRLGTPVGNLCEAVMPRFAFIELGDKPGPRKVEVMVDGSVAGMMEFSLAQVKGGDALVPTTSWEVDGFWDDYAYLTYREVSSGRNDITLFYWVKESEVPPVNGKFTVVVTVRKGTTVIGTSGDRYPSGPSYSRLTHPFQKADKSFWVKEDLAKLSGEITIEVKTGSKVLRSWTAAVDGAAFKPHPRSDLETTEAPEWLSPRYLNGRNVEPVIVTWLAPVKE